VRHAQRGVRYPVAETGARQHRQLTPVIAVTRAERSDPPSPR
jgi:hypothetical protein